MKKIEFKENFSLVISIVLAVVILFSYMAYLPSDIYAEMLKEDETLKSGSIIIEDDESKRGEYEKHYLTENGSCFPAML